MKKNLTLSFIRTLLIVVLGHISGPIFAMEASSAPKALPKNFAQRATKLLNTLKDDWKCLLDRKRKCTWQQKARITGELVALIALLSGARALIVQKRRKQAEAREAERAREVAKAGREKAVQELLARGAAAAAEPPMSEEEREASRRAQVLRALEGAVASEENVRILGIIRNDEQELTLALRLAVEYGRAEVLNFLLSQREVDRKRLNELLLHAVHSDLRREGYGRPPYVYRSMGPVVKLLLEKGADPLSAVWPTTIWGIAQGQELVSEYVKRLFQDEIARRQATLATLLEEQMEAAEEEGGIMGADPRLIERMLQRVGELQEPALPKR